MKISITASSMHPMKTPFYQYTFKEIEAFFLHNDLPLSGVQLLFRWHYKKKMITPCIVDLAKKSIQKVEEHFDFSLPEIVTILNSEDDTVKFLLKLQDGLTIECVLIPFHSKYTLCISTQVGCAMNCSFCFTGKQGLKRNLLAHEIITQFIHASRWLKENRPEEEFTRPLKNIVFMGQGEPLHNFDEVKKAVDIFLETKGLSIGVQKITISTAGYLPGLMRWNNEMPKVNLALSLHSVFTDTRNELIPINRKFPLEKVIEYIKTIPLQRKQYILYEYLMIKDLNDSEKDARALGELLKGTQSIINLIPFNPIPGSTYLRPLKQTVEDFQKILVEYNLPGLIRTTKGDDILAACGQLNTKQKNTSSFSNLQ